MTLSKIESIGIFLPPHEVSTSDLIKESGLTRLGIRADSVADKLRITHVRFSDGGQRPSDLAVLAAKSALEKAAMRASEIDAVLYCGIDRDSQEPSTASNTAHKLGMDDSHLQLAVDISNACHGFTSSIILAGAQIIAKNWRNVLICCGEKASNRFENIRQDIRAGKFSAEQAPELEGFLSCGDVGAAMILTASEDGKGIVYMKTATRPQHAGLCQVGDMLEKHKKIMKMREICDETEALLKSMEPKSICEHLGWNIDDIDYLIQHQVGLLPLVRGARCFGIPRSKCPSIFERLGNLTTASIPVTLDQCKIDHIDTRPMEMELL